MNYYQLNDTKRNREFIDPESYSIGSKGSADNFNSFSGSLLGINDAPQYTIDGYILSGYRREMSFKECLKSIFQLHNQTLNIWSSITVLMVVMCLTAYCTTIVPDIPVQFVVMFVVHGAMRSFCWLNSFLYHTFVCHSERTANTLCILDYVACYLSTLGIGSNLLFIELYCYPFLQAVFVSFGVFMTLTMSVIAIFPVYQSEVFRPYRMVLSLLCCLPFIMGIFAAILTTHHGSIPHYYIHFIYAFMVESVAAFCYVYMIPERLYPRVFDIWLPSHSLWHWFNLIFDITCFRFAYIAYAHLRDHSHCISN